jgi:hypothetical protein
MMGQIMYNKAKPYSYQSEELLTVNQLPTLEYNVSSDGNLSIDNLNVNVKEKALIEKKGDKYIITDDIEISNIFNDDKLHTSVICNSECSELNIGIFSIHGELLISKDFRIKKGVNEFMMDLNKLNTGMYLIRYSPDGVYKNVEKLIIVK